MAFISLIFVMILFIILLISFIAFFISTIVFILFRRKEKNQKKYRIAKYICIPVMAVSSIPLMIFFVLICIVIHERTIIPDSYVACEKITYTENGFITENEEEFVKLSFSATSVLLEQEKIPAYSYAPKGRYNHLYWHNIYQIQTQNGQMIYYEWNQNNHTYPVYVNQKEEQALKDYYRQNYFWTTDLFISDRQQEVSEEISNFLEQYKNKENFEELLNFSTEHIFYAVSKDHYLSVFKMTLMKSDDQLALAVMEEIDHAYHYYGFVLKEEEAAMISSYFDSFQIESD